MNSKRPESVPKALPIHDAIDRSAPLARLRERIDDSHRRFEAVRPLLPASLAAHVRPGPVDDTGWTLLAANASVAAKLRQLQPRLEQTLNELGWQVNATRIRVQAEPLA